MCSRRCALPAVALAPTPSFRNIYTQPPARHATLAAGTRHPEALAVTLTPANGDIHCHAMLQAPRLEPLGRHKAASSPWHQQHASTCRYRQRCSRRNPAPEAGSTLEVASWKLHDTIRWRAPPLTRADTF